MASFSSPFTGRDRPATAGFTLLEVMVAVAVIAIALVTLIGVQSQMVTIATGAKFDAQASLLGQAKMAELSLIASSELNDGSGDFGSEYPGFTWKAAVSPLTEDDTGIPGVAGMLKAIELTVAFDQDPNQSYVLRTIIFHPRPAEAR